MPIEFRRIVGVASLALFVLVVLFAFGSTQTNALNLNAVKGDLPLKFFVPFGLWLFTSFFAKLAMITDFSTSEDRVTTILDRVLAVLAVASAGTMFILNNIDAAVPSPTVGGIVAVAWILSWFLIDLTDLLIPQSWWKQ